MELDLRPPTEEEWPDFCSSMMGTFIEKMSDEDVAAFRAVADIDRALVGVDGGGRVRSTGGSYSLRMNVPGGSVPCCGVSWITVSTPFRRQGVLREMMGRIFELARERDEPVAALFAAEGGIYRRFGFGIAARMWDFRIQASALGGLPAPPGRVTEVDMEEAARRFPPVFDAAYHDRPGVNARDDRRWAAELRFWEEERKSWDILRFLVYTDRSGQDTGCAQLRLKGGWESHRPAATAKLSDLHHVDAEAASAIWRYAASVDLVTTVKAGQRPTDDPLPLLLPNPRDVLQTAADELWVRLLDPAVALSSRAYRAPGALRLEVSDTAWPAAAGVYELEAGEGMASCKRTRRRPDIEMDAAELGAVYLGSVSFTQLAAAGLVSERRAGAVRQADAMFAWAPAAFSPEVF